MDRTWLRWLFAACVLVGWLVAGGGRVEGAEPPAPVAALELSGHSDEGTAPPGLDTFLRATNRPDAWEVRLDRRSGRPQLLQGGGVAMIPGPGNDLDAIVLAWPATPTLAQVARRVNGWLDRHPGLLAPVGTDLRLDPRKSRGRDGRWSIELQQYHDGLPVRGAHVFFRIVQGNAIQLGSRTVAPVAVDTRPALDRAAAWRRLLAHWPEARHADHLLPGTLELQPVSSDAEGAAYRGARGQGYQHHLVWRFAFRPLGGAVHDAAIDAHTGALVVLASRSRSQTGSVHGDVAINGAPATRLPMPFAAVLNQGEKITDLDGDYPYDGGTASIAFDGRYARVQDACGPLLMSNDVDGHLELEGGGTDCRTPGVGGSGNTLAARTAHHYLSLINRKAATFHPTEPFLDAALLARTNQGPFVCNALFDGESVRFFASGQGCANTGELPAVVLHEWGHAMDLAAGGTAVEAGSGEAVADTFAFLETGDGCIGRGFYLDGAPCTNCRPTCDGIRDLEPLAIDGGAVIARPDTVATADGLGCNRWSCPYSSGGQPYRGPLGYQGHCESQIASAALWDLRRSLIGAWGREVGLATLDRLWFDSLYPAGSAYRVADGTTCEPFAAVDGCAADNWYTVFLALDDDDGTLVNGTPNGCRIWRAFNAHGIACGSPLPCSGDLDQPPWVQISAPSVSVEIMAGEAVSLAASAWDSEDGDLGRNLVWASDREGVLGSGSPLSVGLPPGHHVVTASVTDSSGQRGFDLRSIAVRVQLTLTVTELEDTADGACELDHCSLREAIIAANANPGLDTVVIPAGWHTLSIPGTDEAGSATGDLNVLDDLVLEGAGAGRSVIDAGAIDRLMSIGVANVTLRDLTLRGGFTLGVSTLVGDPSAVPFVGSAGRGGALYAGAGSRLLLERCELVDNVAHLEGAIGGMGGGLYVADGGVAEIVATTIRDNRTVPSPFSLSFGGGLFVAGGGAVRMSNSTVAGNHAEANFFGDGEAASGIHVAAGGALSLTHSTVANNPPLVDGTSALGGVTAAADTELRWGATILSGRCELASSVSSLGGSIESPGTSCGLDPQIDRGGVTEVELSLGPLGNHGGATATYLPAAGSAALDLLATADCPATDQRGVPRPQDGDLDGVAACDAGAVEREGLPPDVPLRVVVLQSIANQDGWILESSATSGVGGRAQAGGAGRQALRVGDDAQGRAVRALVSFDTSVIPIDATVLSATLRLRRGRLQGDDPFATHGPCLVAMASGYFGGSVKLEVDDFEAPGLGQAVGGLGPALEDGDWSEAPISVLGLAALDRLGVSQMRIGFALEDDGDGVMDRMGYYSADHANAANHPQLVVTYRD